MCRQVECPRPGIPSVCGDGGSTPTEGPLLPLGDEMGVLFRLPVQHAHLVARTIGPWPPALGAPPIRRTSCQGSGSVGPHRRPRPGTSAVREALPPP
jgi:hypothetical protein